MFNQIFEEFIYFFDAEKLLAGLVKLLLIKAFSIYFLISIDFVIK